MLTHDFLALTGSVFAQMKALRAGCSSPMVSMLNKLVAVQVPRPYVLKVRFQDGASGLHDFSSVANESGPMAEPFRDPNFFARVKLDYGAPTWPNGYDMCPDWLRMEMDKAGELAGVAAE